MNGLRVLLGLALTLLCLFVGFYLGQRAFSAEATPTPADSSAQATLNAHVAGAATALALTARPPSGPEHESFGLSLYPAQVLDPTQMIISGQVTVTAAVPDAVRLEYYVQRDEAGAPQELLFADANGSDGWTWAWTVPECCWRGRVWAVAHYADGSRANSNSILVFTPDVAP